MYTYFCIVTLLEWELRDGDAGDICISMDFLLYENLQFIKFRYTEVIHKKIVFSSLEMQLCLIFMNMTFDQTSNS